MAQPDPLSISSMRKLVKTYRRERANPSDALAMKIRNQMRMLVEANKSKAQEMVESRHNEVKKTSILRYFGKVISFHAHTMRLYRVIDDAVYAIRPDRHPLAAAGLGMEMSCSPYLENQSASWYYRQALDQYGAALISDYDRPTLALSDYEELVEVFSSVGRHQMAMKAATRAYDRFGIDPTVQLCFHMAGSAAYLNGKTRIDIIKKEFGPEVLQWDISKNESIEFLPEHLIALTAFNISRRGPDPGLVYAAHLLYCEVWQDLNPKEDSLDKVLAPYLNFDGDMVLFKPGPDDRFSIFVSHPPPVS